MTVDDLRIPAGPFTDRELRLVRDYAETVAGDVEVSEFVRRLHAGLAQACRVTLTDRANRAVEDLGRLDRHGFPDWETCVQALPPDDPGLAGAP